MQLAETTTVAEMAASSLDAVRIFEKYGIDYCCGGKRPLSEVCAEKGQDLAAITRELESVLGTPAPVEQDWQTAPLKDLAAHIVGTHHGYLRREFPAIQQRLDKVFRVYNQRYGPTLIGLPEAFAGLRAEMETHSIKEETVIFPAIVACEEAAQSGSPLPAASFQLVADSIRLLETEHESAGQALAQIRQITADFHLPDYACTTYRALMAGLQGLEQDLHLHIHLENNILFPRAGKLAVAAR
ncbi:MAG: iron-sulfur cluster repair di-iron protein [Bryobacterales bacterium]|nr:iron-sulfur cluster repair di-iron protein [Bryobacterales bacterium]